MTAARRFTARGGDAVEAQIRGMLDDARSALTASLPADEVRSVVLIGGYGRGEGGVDRSNGAERPNNNLDFLVIARSPSDVADLKRRADEALAPLAVRHEIGMDVGVVTERTLRRGPCLVMWYDMRFGHEPILGDAEFVRELRHLTVERIRKADVRDLLVNRGTLLVINRAMLGAGALSAAQRRAVIRHAVKAIIGYGDALLFFLGEYDASYVEKQRRMRKRHDVPAAFRSLYDEAMEIRFEPRYDVLEKRDLGAWNESLLCDLAPVHLECERRRLGDLALKWPEYTSAAFRRALREGLPSPRALAKKALALGRERRPAPRSLEGRRATLGLLTASARERLSIVFPLVAYDLGEPMRSFARELLDASSGDERALDRAYLRAWGRHGDVNFASALARLGVDLGEAGR